MAATISLKSAIDEQKVILAADQAETPRSGYVAGLYKKDDGCYYEVDDAGVEKKVVCSSQRIQTYSLLSDTLIVTGSEGITATNAGGVITITIPENGVLTNGSFNFEVADATYNATLVTNGIKIAIDNSATSTTFMRQYAPMVYAKTNTTITSSDVATYATALTFNTIINEFAAGISSFTVRDVPANATAGGIIVFS